MNLVSVLKELSRYRPLTDAEVGLLYSNIRAERRKLSPVTQVIVAKAAREYRVGIREIMGKSKVRSIAWARQQVMSDLAARGWSEPRIGAFLKRDPSTVHVGIKAHRARQDANNG